MLKDKVILVAGAAGRIGSVSVVEMLKKGACVLAADNNEEAIEHLSHEVGPNERIRYIKLDITDKNSIKSAFACADTWFGKVDGAMNTSYPRNANYGRSFLDVTFEDFSDNLSMHLGGYFLFMQQCVQYTVDKKAPFSLVNLSSIYGVIAPRFDIYAGTEMTMPVEYAAIKSAINHLTQYASAYAKNLNFRANIISPGGIFSGQPEPFLMKYKQECRIKGMLDPRDIVGTALFLLSDASEYVCGQNIIVDDGFCL